MKFSRIGIGLKFAIAITPLIILTMFGVATLIINYQRESLRQSVYESNLSMTKNLANDSVESLLSFDPLRLDELVRTAVEASSCTYAVIADREGIVVAHTNRKFLGSRLSDGGQQATGRTSIEGKGFRAERLLEGVPVIEFSFPSEIGGQTLGVATVAFSSESIDHTIGVRLSRLKRYIYMITGIMVLAGIIGAFTVSNFLTKPLKKLKDRMLDVQAGNLDVEVENKKIVNCCERLGCDKTECPAFGKTRCWAIAGTFCHGEVQGDFARKIGDCRKCVVYKESCGDEIHELVEVFNQMVKDLRHNLDQLESANKEKAKMERLSALGEMAATVAHETKNPLNSIRVATSYLKKNFRGEILTEFLSIIDEEIGRLNDITTNFLGFSRPAPMNLKVCDLNSVVRPAVELIRQEATDRNVEVILLMDERLPATKCDASKMKQAILNLLLNALDVLKEGDTISVTTEAHGSYVQISVQDSGPGISPENLEKIFKPFYTTKTRGSGLGLAIVERIVKDHGGDIDVHSVVGEGTTIAVRIPSYEYAKL